MDLRLPRVFSDHMVLQQGIAARVWGWTAPAAKVTIRFAGQAKTAVADAKGRWELRLDAMPASAEPRNMQVAAAAGKQKAKLVFHDVLVGEVWLCSGQSNMQFQLADARDGARDVPLAWHGQMRLFTVPATLAVEPACDVGSGQWAPCTPQEARRFSAVGYYFGLNLHRLLGVPVGLINASWGGTVAEAWTSRQALADEPTLHSMVQHMGPSPQWVAILNSRPGAPLSGLDLGNAGWLDGWAAEGNPPGEWGNMDLPKLWQHAGLNFNGVVWFRRTIQVPASWAGQDLALAVGACDKADVTYFNNVQVGSLSTDDDPNAWATPREYTVPGKLVHTGDNVIAVRVCSWMYGGGMWGPAAKMWVAPVGAAAADRLPLTGAWSYRVEQDFGIVGPNRPTVLFNGMIAPLRPFAMRGAIWYQGEANADRAEEYRTLFPTMIRCWRQEWTSASSVEPEQDEFSFLFVQLANYMARQAEPSETKGWAAVREAQAAALTLPNTGMAVATDIGDGDDIHPRNKDEVGRRLAMLALAKAHGWQAPCDGPAFAKASVVGGAMRVKFDHCDSDLTCHGASLEGFAVAGKDRRFVWAQAKIEGNTVVVRSDAVPKPVAVRYNWASNPVGNLFNGVGLPAAPFRTDDWKLEG